ncbi:FtsX-like permease family protein [Tropheryma whipplei]|uniref:FtsX-like permease family protein n=1 Tax=Tropheryma whipplei TaxID=2039 RepID=UPI0004B51E05|nr:FtsX-like permease family protein [Tropheryma whipplei]
MLRIFSLARADLRLMLSRNRPLVVILIFMVTVVLLLQTAVLTVLGHFARDLDKKSSLSLIEISSYLSGHSLRPITDDSIKKLQKMEHIEGVYPELTHDLILKEGPQSQQGPEVVFTRVYTPGTLQIAKGSVPDTGPGPGEIILPQNVRGGTLDNLLGKDVDFSYTVALTPTSGTALSKRFRVIATYKSSLLYKGGPLLESYLHFSEVKALSAKSVPGGPSSVSLPPFYPSAFIKVDSVESVPLLREALAKTGEYWVQGFAPPVGLVGSLTILVNGGLLALIVFCVIFGFLAGSAWFRSRRKDIAVLRTTGWSRGMLFALSAVELGSLGLLGTLFGILVSIGVGQLISLLMLLTGSTFLGSPFIPLPGLDLLLGALILIPLVIILGGLPQSIRLMRTPLDNLLRN